MEPVYLVGYISVEDRELWDSYERQGLALLKGVEGIEALVVDEDVEVLEGEWSGNRTIVVRFPSRKVAEEWYKSEAYQEIVKLRRGAGTANLVLAKAFSPGPPG